MSLPPVTLIGTGALGTACLRAFDRYRIPVKSIYNRTAPPAPETLFSAGMPFTGAFPETVDRLGGLIFITVADEAIEPVAGRLAGLEGDWDGRHVVHCSGTLSSAVFDPLARKGAGTASFHPLQTFNARSGPEDFNGIRFSTEGNPATVKLLERMAATLEASLYPATPESKPYIHLAAVLSANYLFGLMEAARKAGEEGSLPGEPLMEALQPLVEQTARNIGEEGLEGALSGPIARGDAGTVRRHLELLSDNPELQDLYRRLGREVLGIVRRTGKGDDPRHAELERLLGG